MSLYDQDTDLLELLWDDELDAYGRGPRGGMAGASRGMMPRVRARTAARTAASSRPSLSIPKALRPQLQQPGYMSQDQGGFDSYDEGYRSFAPAPYEESAPGMDPDQIADMVMQEISGPSTFGALGGPPARRRLSMDEEITDEIRARYGTSGRLSIPSGRLSIPSGRLSMDEEITDEIRARYGTSGCTSCGCDPRTGYGCSPSPARYGAEGVQVWNETKDWNAEHAAAQPPAQPAHSAFWESAKIGAGVGVGLLAVGVLAGALTKAFR